MQEVLCQMSSIMADSQKQTLDIVAACQQQTREMMVACQQQAQQMMTSVSGEMASERHAMVGTLSGLMQGVLQEVQGLAPAGLNSQARVLEAIHQREAYYPPPSDAHAARSGRPHRQQGPASSGQRVATQSFWKHTTWPTTRFSARWSVPTVWAGGGSHQGTSLRSSRGPPGDHLWRSPCRVPCREIASWKPG